MLSRIALAVLLAGSAVFAQGQNPDQQEERPKVPKDSVMAVITGCIKGRVIRASDVRQTDTTSGVNIRSHTFRLAGKKDVMNDVKANDGHFVEVTGLIKKSALIEPGVRFKGGRVVIGGGRMGPGSLPDPAENVVVLDAIAVSSLNDNCGGL